MCLGRAIDANVQRDRVKQSTGARSDASQASCQLGLVNRDQCSLAGVFTDVNAESGDRANAEDGVAEIVEVIPDSMRRNRFWLGYFHPLVREDEGFDVHCASVSLGVKRGET